MLFGEIVEPSTRALIDDEFDDYPEYTEPSLNWKGNPAVPTSINNLIVVESEKIIKFFKTLVISGQSICSLTNGTVEIYKLPPNNFVITYKENELSTGEITEILSPWLQRASNIYAITSASIISYYNPEILDKPESLIRMLATGHLKDLTYQRLEAPNIVTGLGAQVLSYSIHTGLKCALFVIYLSNSPLDSLNVNPLTELVKSINLPFRKSYADLNPPESNLYL